MAKNSLIYSFIHLLELNMFQLSIYFNTELLTKSPTKLETLNYLCFHIKCFNKRGQSEILTVTEFWLIHIKFWLRLT